MKLLTDPEIGPLRDIFDTYELLAYLPIRAARLGYQITEIPVTRAYPANESTPTKIYGTQAHARILRILINASLGKYVPKNKLLAQENL
jgi:dolichol-phosphate mannosyltransferase